MSEVAFDVTDEELRTLLRERAGAPSPQPVRRRRRRAFVVAAFALAALAAAPAIAEHEHLHAIVFPRVDVKPFTGSKTIAVDWREQMGLHKGALRFRVERVEVRGTRWRVKGAITNASPYTVIVRPPESWEQTIMGNTTTHTTTSLGLAFQASTITGTAWVNRHAKRFTSTFPLRLKPGKTWAGFWGGDDELPRAQPIWVTFGYFIPIGMPMRDPDPYHIDPNAPPAGLSWTTDHTFALK